MKPFLRFKACGAVARVIAPERADDRRVAGRSAGEPFELQPQRLAQAGPVGSIAKRQMLTAVAGQPDRVVVAQGRSHAGEPPGHLDDLVDRARHFRNDQALRANPAATSNAHTMSTEIADPAENALAVAAQSQIALFFASRGTALMDCSSAPPLIDVPIVRRAHRRGLPRHVALQQRAGGHHLDSSRAPCQQSMEAPAVATVPVQHRVDAQAREAMSQLQVSRS